MAVSIVTDSTSDIPESVARELGITVVPCYVRFGMELYREGVDLSTDELYRMLEESEIHPSTTQPPPEDFAEAYRKLGQEAEGIVSIHISSKLSGVCNSALQASKTDGIGCRVEVVDSLFNSVGLGLITIAAARIARTGAGIQAVLDETARAISQVKMLGIFDTLKYMIRGGRVSRLKGMAVSILRVKPMLTFNDGEVAPAGLARTYNKGVDKLVTFIERNAPVSALAIAHSNIESRALALRERLEAFLPQADIMISDLGPTLGVHGGPGVLLVALRCES